jgi:thymidylate synthase (FAD)
MGKIIFRSDMTVELVQSMASDEVVANAARVSSGSEGTPEANQKLINYLMRDRHGSPFEHNAFTFRIEAPIFVFRELMRHRIASYNEESGRYKQLEPVFYIPDENRKLIQVGKPGAYTFEQGTAEQTFITRDEIEVHSTESYLSYKHLLDEGVAREVARMCLPVNIYSSAYMTINARSLMNLLSLRSQRQGTYPSFPQYEISEIAELMEHYFAVKMPATYNAFIEHGRVAP